MDSLTYLEDMYILHILGFMAQRIYQADAMTNNVNLGDKKCHIVFL